MRTNKEITENFPFTRKGICAECGKSLFIDSEGNSEYDFYQHRRYSTMNYKIDYHFCSQSCMQKKIGKQPLSNIQAKAEGYKQGQADTIKKLEELAEDIYGKYIGEEHIEKTKGRWLGVMECIVLLNGKCTIQDRIEVPEV